MRSEIGRRRFVSLLVLFVSVTASYSLGPEAERSESPPYWTLSRMAFSSDLGLLYVVHRDAGEVVALSAANGFHHWRAKVGDLPGMVDLARVADRSVLIVSSEGSGEIRALDPASGEELRRMWVGHGPRGFAVLEERVVAVALYLEHKVTLWDLVTGELVRELATERFPTTVFASEGFLYVPGFFSSEIQVLDSETGEPERSLNVAFQANQISTLTTMEGGKTLLMPHLLSNTRQPDLHLANTIFPAVSFVPVDGTEPKTLSLALIGDVINGPEALAVVPGRGWLLTANSRSNDVSAVDLSTELSAGKVDVGRYPLGIVVDAEERHAFVQNAFDHTVSVVRLDDFQQVAQWSYGEEVLPAEIARGRDLFHDAGSLNLVLNQWVSCSNCHPDGLTDGRIWSLPGRPPLRTKSLADFAETRPGGWLASFDEMQDEELFIRDFFLGLGLSESEPNPHLAEPNEGLSADLDAMSEYVYSLKTAPSPFLVDGELSPAAQRGKEIFFAERTGCASCHPPPTYTISSLDGPGPVANPVKPALLQTHRERLLEESAVLVASQQLERIDVPSLLGLYREPSFLHDGRARTLVDVFETWNPEDLHGVTSHLSAGDLEDLAMFLRSLPYEPWETADSMATIDRDEPTPPPARVGDSVSSLDWVQWRGSDGNGVMSGVRIEPEALANGPGTVWSQPLGRGFSGIVSRDGILYTADLLDDEETVIAASAETGEVLWRHALGPSVLDGHLGDGPRATPAVSEQAVYMVGSRGDIVAVDRHSGEEIWRFSIPERTDWRPPYGFSASPLLWRDLVIYPMGGDDGGGVIALDRADGSVRWSSGDGPISYSTPTIGELAGRTQLVALTNQGVWSLDPVNGDELWRHDWLSTPFDSAVSPILTGENGVFVSASGEGSLLLRVTPSEQGFEVETVWETSEASNDYATSALVKGSLYGSSGSFLFALSPEDGREIWRDRGFHLASVTALDNEWLLSLSYDCELKLLDPRDGEPEILATFTAFEFQRCLTAPTILGNMLYLRNEKQMAAFRLDRAEQGG